jgi:hypothetical protein
MNAKRAIDQDFVRGSTVMSYLVELQQPAGPLAYVVAQAGSQDHARALIYAELGRDDANDEVVIVGVHAIH